tara:strand:+ start:31984 stop:32199 length:216 start_codon:yes stop_codon:yes gene_type:complete
MDEDLVQWNFEAGLISLALGCPPETMIEMMEEYADEDEFEIAEGYKQALTEFLSKGSQYSRVRQFTDLTPE